MKAEKLIINGHSQETRLSNDPSIWDIWERNLMKYEEPLLSERSQPSQQERDGLDELFD